MEWWRTASRVRRTEQRGCRLLQRLHGWPVLDDGCQRPVLRGVMDGGERMEAGFQERRVGRDWLAAQLWIYT